MFEPLVDFFFFQAEDGIRDYKVTGVQTCALPICNYIWDKIRRLAQNGCRVKIIFGAVDSGLLARMKDARRAGLIEIGRASCRERVAVEVGAGCVQKIME